MDEKSMQDDLADAWDDSEEEVESQEANDDAFSSEADESPGEPAAASEAGSDDDQPAEPAASASDADPDGVPDPEKPDEEAGPELNSVGAPVGLSPEAREVWKDTPKAMQDAVVKREADYSTGIQQYAEKAHRAEGMDRALAPFQQYMAMNGGPGATIKNLMETGATLQMGSPLQKAQMVASLISQFGVDITELDNILVGKAPSPEAAQTSQFQSAMKEQLEPIHQFMGQMQQQQQHQFQAQQSAIGSEVEQFSKDPKNEFYADVSDAMADYMDMAATRGQDVSMQKAYDIACRLHPGISKIIAGRETAQNAGRKRIAASSISGNQGGDGPAAVAGSMRDSINNAWDEAGQM